jgi:uncharacterized protein (DUF433 family)
MTNGEYKYVGPRRGTLYRQWFVKGRGLRAYTVYLDIVGPEQMTPEQAAENWNLSLEAVLECIDYCEKNADVIRQDWEEEEEVIARMRAADPRAFPKPPKS